MSFWDLLDVNEKEKTVNENAGDDARLPVIGDRSLRKGGTVAAKDNYVESAIDCFLDEIDGISKTGILSAISIGRILYKISSKKQYEDTRLLLKNNTIYREAVYMASDVYNDRETNLIGGWHRCSDFAHLKLVDVDGTGLVSAVYKRSNNGRVEYVYAVAGTNPTNPNDWKANITQIIGESDQYKLALDNARKIKRGAECQGASLRFVGHSLGGGISINNALVLQCPAIVFNPAGISDDTKMKSGAYRNICKADELISNFISDTDILNLLQDSFIAVNQCQKMLSVSDGKRYYIRVSDVKPFSHSIADLLNTMDSYV